MKERFFKSLSFKIALAVILSISVIAGISFFGIYLKQRSFFFDIEKEKAKLISSAIESSLVGAMLSGKSEDVQGVVEKVANENPEHIVEIAIFSHEWKKSFSSIPSKRRTSIDRDKDEGCLVCHRLPPEKRPRTAFVEVEGSKVVRGVVPIKKRGECLKCHTQEEKLRGMLLVDLNLHSFSERLYTNTIWVFTGGAITFFALVGVIFLSINRIVTNPIGRVAESIQRIGSGDLKHRVDNPKLIGRKDSIGILAYSINDMASSIKGIFSKILELASNVESVTGDIVSNTRELTQAASHQKTSAMSTAKSMDEMKGSILEITDSVNKLSTLSDETSSSMLEMTASIEEVSQNAEGLANAVEDSTSSITQMLTSIKEVASNTQGLSASAAETAASMNEINASIREVERNANASQESSRKTSLDAEEGFKTVEETIKGITETKDIIKSLNLSIEHLGERSKEIGKILNIIDQIADQTSLLALNASIIAAQAGEHGKPFGVVASEIKKLSEQTTASTKEIAGLIEAVQSETAKATDNMHLGEKSINKGVELAFKAREALKAILESSKKSLSMVQGIVKATEEQTKGTGYVTKATEGVREMVEKIASATQEQSKGAEFIAKQVEHMKELTSFVKRATSEQSRGSKQVSESMVGVNERIKRIHKATQGQRDESERVIGSVGRIVEFTEKHLESVKEIETVVYNLSQQVNSLKEELGRFKL